jgi:RecB family exonuclease
MQLEALSPSKIDTFDECQLKYRAIYEEGLKTKPHPLTSMGSALHKMFELATRARITPGTPEFLHDPYHHEAGAVAEFDVQPDLVPLLRELTQNAIRWGYFRNVHRCIGVEIEFRFALPDVTPVRGLIDRLDVWEDVAEIIDIKTQKNPLDTSMLKNDWQARIYNLAARIIQPTIKGKIRVAFWVLRHQVQPVWLTADDAKKTEEDLVAKAAEIRACTDPQPNPSGLCPWCPKYDACTAAHEGLKSKFKKKRATA